jgi:hypothetical protein
MDEKHTLSFWRVRDEFEKCPYGTSTGKGPPDSWQISAIKDHKLPERGWR